MHKFDCNANKSFNMPVAVEAATLPSVICCVKVCGTPAVATVVSAAAAIWGTQPLSPDTNACVTVGLVP